MISFFCDLTFTSSFYQITNPILPYQIYRYVAYDVFSSFFEQNLRKSGVDFSSRRCFWHFCAQSLGHLSKGCPHLCPTPSVLLYTARGTLYTVMLCQYWSSALVWFSHPSNFKFGQLCPYGQLCQFSSSAQHWYSPSLNSVNSVNYVNSQV